MFKEKKLWKIAFLFVLSVFVLTSCATRVRLEADRTPTMNTVGIQRIAVLPFAVGSPETPLRQAIAEALTTGTSIRIEETGAFTLVSAAVVAGARARGENIEHLVDAVFTGRVTGYTVTTTEIPTIIPGAGHLGPTNLRTVNIRFEYFFENAHDGSIVGPIRRTGTAFSTQLPPEAINFMVERLPGLAQIPARITLNATLGTLTDYPVLGERAVNNQLRLLYRDVSPHTIRVVRPLESEPDRDLRPQMNAAHALMRAGEHEDALDAYIAIWESHGSTAAALNASILFELIGGLEEAIHFLERVYVETWDARVSNRIDDLNFELAELMGVADIEDPRTPAEIVAEHAINEIEGVIAADANVWIQNVATAYQHLANEVADSIVYSFLGAGRTVVERQMIDAILAEQDLHMTGMIADSDFISIGSLAGADTLIVIDMTGSARSRRLQVRVMDIAQATLLMQSGTGVAWRL